MVDLPGWGWAELALVPTDAGALARLGDDRRIGLFEWNWEAPDAEADAPVIVEIATREIRRLHGA